AKCHPNASECAGVCLSFGPDQTMCSSPCSLGGEKLDTQDCGGLQNGLCIFGPQKDGLGDGGYCTPSCDVHEQCQNPLLWCFSFAGPTGTTLPKGYCFLAKECPGGNSDCSGTGMPCVTTQYGPYCIDAARFATATPNGAGGSGGGP